MSTVIIPVGLPGSGKTTVLKEEARLRDAVYICPDDIRAELTGDTMDQSRNQEVWRLTHQRMAAALTGDHHLVVDATNTDQYRRRFLADFCRIWQPQAQIELWYFATPPEVCKQRNAARERIVPDYVIDWKYQQLLKHPIDMATEGFDLLIVC